MMSTSCDLVGAMAMQGALEELLQGAPAASSPSFEGENSSGYKANAVILSIRFHFANTVAKLREWPAEVAKLLDPAAQVAAERMRADIGANGGLAAEVEPEQVLTQHTPAIRLHAGLFAACLHCKCVQQADLSFVYRSQTSIVYLADADARQQMSDAPEREVHKLDGVHVRYAGRLHTAVDHRCSRRSGEHFECAGRYKLRRGPDCRFGQPQTVW